MAKAAAMIASRPIRAAPRTGRTVLVCIWRAADGSTAGAAEVSVGAGSATGAAAIGSASTAAGAGAAAAAGSLRGLGAGGELVAVLRAVVALARTVGLAFAAGAASGAA